MVSLNRAFTIILLLLCASAVNSESSNLLDRFRHQNTPALRKEAAEIARRSLIAYYNGKPMPVFHPSPLLRKQSGVFVTFKVGDRVRGCMGNLDARRSSIAHEIAENAVAAAVGDSRYHHLSQDELPRVHYYISIIGPRRRVHSMTEICPAKHGLLVQWNDRGGVLLPGEAKTAEWQVAECRRKAGIPPRVPVQLFIFETVVLDYGV